MELNREQIIKALECCNGGDCETCKALGVACDATWKFHKDALALIKELTEENERLRDTAYRLECEVHRERADTVRKMQERLYPLYKVLCVDEGDWRYEVDQIAKEMLEANNERT